MSFNIQDLFRRLKKGYFQKPSSSVSLPQPSPTAEQSLRQEAANAFIRKDFEKIATLVVKAVHSLDNPADIALTLAGYLIEDREQTHLPQLAMAYKCIASNAPLNSPEQSVAIDGLFNIIPHLSNAIEQVAAYENIIEVTRQNQDVREKALDALSIIIPHLSSPEDRITAALTIVHFSNDDRKQAAINQIFHDISLIDNATKRAQHNIDILAFLPITHPSYEVAVNNALKDIPDASSALERAALYMKIIPFIPEDSPTYKIAADGALAAISQLNDGHVQTAYYAKLVGILDRKSDYYDQATRGLGASLHSPDRSSDSTKKRPGSEDTPTL